MFVVRLFICLTWPVANRSDRSVGRFVVASRRSASALRCLSALRVPDSNATPPLSLSPTDAAARTTDEARFPPTHPVPFRTVPRTAPSLNPATAILIRFYGGATLTTRITTTAGRAFWPFRFRSVRARARSSCHFVAFSQR